MSDVSSSFSVSTSPAGTTPPPKKRRRWLRRIMWFIVFLLAIVTFAPYALALKPVREFVASKASAVIGRTTTIGGASGSWWDGFELRDIEVHNPEGWKGDPLVSIDRVHLDVKVLKLLTGSLDGSLDVEKPVLTLLRTTDGRSNADGLMPESDEPPPAKKKSSGSMPAFVVRVRNGRVVGQELGAATPSAPDEIVDITVDAEVGPDGHKLAAFSAVAKRASPGGADAKLSLDAKLSGSDSGPVALSIPQVDLARFAHMIASATGFEGLAGTFEAKADLVLDAQGKASGRMTASLAGLRARRGEQTFSIGSTTFDIHPTTAAGTTTIEIAGQMKDVVIVGGAGSAPFNEPAVTLGVIGAWDDATKKLTLSKGTVAAGALSAQLKPGFVIDAGEHGGASGEAVVDADFARLTTLRALVPSLDSITGGKLHAEAKLTATDGMSAVWSVRADRLAFSPGALSTNGYVEPLTTMRGAFAHTASGDMTLGIDELSSSIASLAKAASGMKIRVSDAGPVVESPGTLTVDLAALGRAMDKAVGLKPGESLAGSIDITPTGSSTAAGATFTVDLVGRGVQFPGGPAGSLSGKIVGRTDTGSKTTTIDSATLAAFGINVRATASMGPDATGATAMRSAQVGITGDLGTARPLLASLMGLASDAQLGGRLQSDLTIAPAGAARTVRGKTTIDALHFVSGRDPANPSTAPTTFDEPQVVLQHDLTLDASGPDSMRFDQLTLTSSAVTASITGSARGSAEDRVLDATMKLDADASKLATRLKAFMGAGYEDMSGEGRITGQVVLVGPTGRKMHDLKIDGNLAFQRFSSSGITAENGSLRVVRANPASPLTLALTSTINRGSVKVDGSCDLGRGESPWSTKVTIRGLDTSPMLVNKGAGHYLTLVMPAIIPADATTNVLSGLLDADLDVKSLAIDQPRLADTLSGPGSVRMTQGSVKDSTIFSSLAGGGAGKGVGALIKLVPGVGTEFANLSKALMFQSLASTFTIASRQLQLNPVEMVSPSVNLKFSGVVGFDGSSELSIPLVLGGDVGKSIEKYIPDRTIPLKVSSKAGGGMRVTPDLSAEKLAQGGLLDKGKDVLDGLLGGKKKKPK